MHELKILWAGYTPIKDISVLGQLKSLSYLRLDGDLVEDWTPLLSSKTLQTLKITHEAARKRAKKQLGNVYFKF